MDATPSPTWEALQHKRPSGGVGTPATALALPVVLTLDHASVLFAYLPVSSTS